MVKNAGGNKTKRDARKHIDATRYGPFKRFVTLKPV